MIRVIQSTALLILPLVASCVMNAQAKYVGKSGCDPLFEWGPGSYSIRLDSTQNAYLVAHTIEDTNVLLIIKYQSNNDKCGIVRDAVVSGSREHAFEFGCVDQVDVSSVVVGTRPDDDQHVAGKASQAWLVRAKTLTFTPDRHHVICKRSSLAGNDGGEDLATIAKKRNSKATAK